MDLPHRVAIVGIGGVFSQSPTPGRFWDHVVSGRDTSREVPTGRWALHPRDVVDPRPGRPDRALHARGYFVDDLPAPTPVAADLAPLLGQLDPLFRLTLCAGRQAWDDAVHSHLDPARVGVILGNIYLPTEGASRLTEATLGRFIAERLLPDRAPPAARVHPWERHPAGLPAALLARGLGVAGPAYTLDAACASSLYALKLAAEELLAGRLDAVLTGGVSRPDALYTQMGFSQLRALSPTGRCRPFDAAADGLVVGEGAGVFVLKRLADALLHGDRIYATVAGVGLSNDTRGNLLKPDPEGQLRAMQAAYRQAGWSPHDVGLIECHAAGTQVGDFTELQSLKALWHGSPPAARAALGSAKANVGHCLTAAGAAGLLKVLLALRHETLPPTANFTNPRGDAGLAGAPFAIPVQAAPWPAHADRPRRAAVSAFGFGGINAHVLLEEWREGGDRVQVPVTAAPPVNQIIPLAIVGIEAHLGPWRSREEYRQRIFGRPAADRPPAGVEDRWWGVEELDWFPCRPAEQAAGFIAAVRIDPSRFHIPPLDLAEMLPQQALMLDVAARALRGSGWQPEFAPRTGVFIGLNLDLNTTNFHLRWSMLPLARRALTGAEADAVAALTDALRDAVGPPLTAGKTLGALASITASRIAREFAIGGPSFTVSGEDASGLAALDAAAGFLRRGEIDYALVGAVDFSGDVRDWLARNAPDTLTGAAEPGDPPAAAACEGAVAVLLRRLGDCNAGEELHAVVREIVSRTHPTAPAGPADPDRRDAAGDAGHTGAAGFLAALAGAALSLRHRISPASDDRPACYWLADAGDPPRRVTVHCHTATGQGGHCVLEEPPPREPHQASTPSPAGPPTPGLFVVRGRDRDHLREQLNRLRSAAGSDNGLSLHELARRWHLDRRRDGEFPLAVAFVPQDSSHLRRLLDQLFGQVDGGTELQEPGDPAWSNLGGTHPPGKVAFVFPGAGNTFPGMGRDLLLQWPQVLHRLEAANRNLRQQFQPDVFWHTGGPRPDTRQTLIGQVALGAAVTDLLALFGVRPQAVVGYSLGESTALFALRAWRHRDEMLRRLGRSPLFATDLAGPCDAARSLWQLPAGESVDWVVHVASCPADAIRRAITGRDRVYLLITNTPGECVVGGRRQAVESLLRDLACPSRPVPGVSTVHCEIVRRVARPYRELHLLPTQQIPEVVFYRGADAAPYCPDRESAADAILAQASAHLDFPALVRRAYADGVRLFVEAGPGASCTRMIGQVLGDRPHLAASACPAEADGVVAFLKLLALLAVNGVPVNLDPLYGSAAAGDPAAHAPAGEAITLRVGHPPLELPALPAVACTDAEIPVPADCPEPVQVGPTASNGLHGLLQSVQSGTAAAHHHYLRFQRRLEGALAAAGQPATPLAVRSPDPEPLTKELEPQTSTEGPLFDRDRCLEFAVGSIGAVLGPAFAEADSFPTRVRLPDEPLMLVDRIVALEGEPKSLTGGRIVTEHDVHAGRWYLDNGCIPACIAIESGQADLFLSGYLGIDFQTRGLAMYRLLDAAVTFHGGLPGPDAVVRYDIHIDRFFRHGGTYLFRFRFVGTVDGEPLLTMTEGCAGFFTPQELAAGKGILPADRGPERVPGGSPPLGHLVPVGKESYTAAQLEALRAGDLAACFGPAFAGLPFDSPLTLPGGRMKLIDRVTGLDPDAATIRAEQDIEPGAWFLTCHFVDDQVMPGTLMYECCLHTFRVLLLRMGWVADARRARFEPVPGVTSRLKCRGQVTASTRTAAYEIRVKEVGYRPEPYAVADAVMYADGRPIVEITDISLRLAETDRGELERLWDAAARGTSAAEAPAPFDRRHILTFATGKPSEAFGEPYRPFDSGRRLARLPAPPYSFIDSVTDVDCPPWRMAAGGTARTQYTPQPDAWYFAANRQPEMPYAVLLEVGLQSCGWLAAYMGSALTSPDDLRFRNLGGSTTLHRPVTPETGPLTTQVHVTRVSASGGMILQHYGFTTADAAGPVLSGTTYFGFFSDQALAQQVGVRDAKVFQPTPAERQRAVTLPYPADPPFPDDMLRMLHSVEHLALDGGPHGLGWADATYKVDPTAWFFRAHFHQDPVCPGSLGLEALVQLLKLYAARRFGGGTRFAAPVAGSPQGWTYRGQILPTNDTVTVQAAVRRVDQARRTVLADGWLSVDGLVIYQMMGFEVGILPGGEGGP